MSTFLIADDSKIMRTLLKDILFSAGHTILGEAENGWEAFEKYKELKPDIVTMDITMSGVDGVEGVKLIHGYDPKAVIIMCSAMAQQWLIVEAIQAGAKGFIVKPFTKIQVLEAISNVTRKL